MERRSKSVFALPPPPYLICLIAALLACHAGRDGFQKAALGYGGALVALPLAGITAAESAAVELDEAARARKRALLHGVKSDIKLSAAAVFHRTSLPYNLL